MESQIKALEERIAELERKVADKTTSIELNLDGEKISNGFMKSIVSGINRAEVRRRRAGSV